MRYCVNTEYDLAPIVKSKYIISPHHRATGKKDKSIWTISYKDEIDCFIQSRVSEWIIGSICWGLKISDGKIQVIGKNQVSDELKIAKFIDGDNKNIWHGYPADHKSKKQDIPDMKILIMWAEKNFINKSEIRKIKQQLSCNL